MPITILPETLASILREELVRPLKPPPGMTLTDSPRPPKRLVNGKWVEVPLRAPPAMPQGQER